MALSMYELTVPVVLRGLWVLEVYLDKAAASATERGIDQAVFFNARLAPDMLPLSRQIQIVSDTSKFAVARLAGIEAPSFPDTEANFEELKERVAKTIAFVKSASAAQFEGSDLREVVLKLRGNEVKFSGKDYLLRMVLPNVFFHITTAHDILRNQGVTLGKADYLGAF